MQAEGLVRAVQPILGISLFVGAAWLGSEARKEIRWRAVIAALIAQGVLALLALRIDFVRHGLWTVAGGIGRIKEATTAGTGFVFGYLGGAPVPFALVESQGSPFIFAFQALPMVMVVSALAMLLFHWGILPIVVRGCAALLSRTLHIGGALGVCAAAKIFLGMMEAPLLIRPYLGKLSRSELFTVMTLGMATTSASVMVLYATLLEGRVDNALAHILTASLISVPAAVALSRLLVPNIEPGTEGEVVVPFQFSGAMDAISQGVSEGLKLFLNIIAMLVVMLALVALLNMGLGALPWPGSTPLSLQLIFGWLLAPVAWLMGIPWSEAFVAGHLIGTKLALNEVMAFAALAQLPEGALSAHSIVIMTYALCGFANLGSIGLLIAGLGTMAPERRTEIIGLSGRALVAGSAASCLSGTVVGLFI